MKIEVKILRALAARLSLPAQRKRVTRSASIDQQILEGVPLHAARVIWVARHIAIDIKRGSRRLRETREFNPFDLRVPQSVSAKSGLVGYHSRSQSAGSADANAHSVAYKPGVVTEVVAAARKIKRLVECPICITVFRTMRPKSRVRGCLDCCVVDL